MIGTAEDMKALETCMEAIRNEHPKFLKGNKAAGVRIRKHLSDMKVVATDFRARIVEARRPATDAVKY